VKPIAPESVPFQSTDVSAEKLANDLRDLGQEVIELSRRLDALLKCVAPLPTISAQKSFAEVISAVIEGRRMRGQIFSPSLFSDPAWDILLHLLAAELSQVRMSHVELADLTDLAGTTAHRWIAIMVDKSIVVRYPDPADARRIFVELHPQASAAMQDFFRSRHGLPIV
jgi:DNA-binding MarR family transcriptional regulator